MSVQSIGTAPAAADSQKAAGGTKQEIQKLEKQKQAFSKKMDQIKRSRISEEEKTAKIHSLKQKIQAIDKKIQNLQQQEGQAPVDPARKLEEDVQKTEDVSASETVSSIEKGERTGELAETEPLVIVRRFDTFEKSKGEEALDNTYRVTQEDGKRQVDFNRLKKQREQKAMDIALHMDSM